MKKKKMKIKLDLLIVSYHKIHISFTPLLKIYVHICKIKIFSRHLGLVWNCALNTQVANSKKASWNPVNHHVNKSTAVAAGVQVVPCRLGLVCIWLWSGRLTAGRWRRVVFCLVKVLCGFEDIRVSWTRHHLLTVAVNRGADLRWAVPGLLWSGLQGGGGERQVHHVQHVSQAPGHLWRNKDI